MLAGVLQTLLSGSMSLSPLLRKDKSEMCLQTSAFSMKAIGVIGFPVKTFFLRYSEMVADNVPRMVWYFTVYMFVAIPLHYYLINTTGIVAHLVSLSPFQVCYRLHAY